MAHIGVKSGSKTMFFSKTDQGPAAKLPLENAFFFEALTNPCEVLHIPWGVPYHTFLEVGGRPTPWVCRQEGSSTSQCGSHSLPFALCSCVGRVLVLG